MKVKVSEIRKRLVEVVATGDRAWVKDVFSDLELSHLESKFQFQVALSLEMGRIMTHGELRAVIRDKRHRTHF